MEFQLFIRWRYLMNELVPKQNDILRLANKEKFDFIMEKEKRIIEDGLK